MFEKWHGVLSQLWWSHWNWHTCDMLKIKMRLSLEDGVWSLYGEYPYFLGHVDLIYYNVTLAQTQTLIRFPTVQKFYKSVNIWQSYRKFNGGNFFETLCIVIFVPISIGNAVYGVLSLKKPLTNRHKICQGWLRRFRGVISTEGRNVNGLCFLLFYIVGLLYIFSRTLAQLGVKPLDLFRRLIRQNACVWVSCIPFWVKTMTSRGSKSF